MDLEKLKELFSGIAVVIDDEINDPEANINKIIRQIESANIPVLKYLSLPEEDIVGHFQNPSFLLLDWKLQKLEKEISIPDGLQEKDAADNLNFIEKLKEICFCPVFIFTNEDTAFIKSKLEDRGLYQDGKPSYLFVQSKSDLQDEGAFFDVVSEWLRETPSIYVLKEWEKRQQGCKTKLFSELHSLNPSWPTIMWKNFEADKVNKSLEMGELISRNLHSRMIPFNFENNILDKEPSMPPCRDELIKLLEGERFLKRESLHEDDVGCGDLFKVEKSQSNETTEFTYYLNIRAQCDLLRSKKVELYCLKGRVVDETKINKKGGFPVDEGHFLEKINHSVVPFLDGGKIIEFLFRNMKIQEWKDLKENRVGRLLPPYITRIQQRYSLYMQRQGLPRIPDAAIFKAAP